MLNETNVTLNKSPNIAAEKQDQVQRN